MRVKLTRLYVAIMLQVVGRGLAASRVDAELRAELAALPAGFQVQMLVLPAGPGMVVQTNGDGTVDLARRPKARPEVSIRFKHLALAFLVLSFQEGTACAFANDRMVADGDIAAATRLVRCLNRMESLILPAQLARFAVKRYSPLRLREKVPKAARIYGLMLRQLIAGG